MKFSDIVGHSHILKVLLSDVENGNYHRSYLFVGPEGIGKATIAKLFAMTMNCSNFNGVDVCLTCKSCLGIQKGLHPDLIHIGQESTVIGVNDVRFIQDVTAVKPVAFSTRVIIVDNAHKMTREASNCFLKLLEEPPLDTAIILVCANIYNVLPTVKSRCKILKFSRIPISVLEKYLLSYFDREFATLLARLSMGSVGLAFSLSQSVDRRAELFNILKTIFSQNSAYFLTTVSHNLSERKSLLEFLEFLLIWLRDVLALICAKDDNLIINVDFSEQVKQYTDQLDVRNVIKLMDLFLKMREYVALNANLNLVIANIFSQMNQFTYSSKEIECEVK